jgi:hypothetical protein
LHWNGNFIPGDNTPLEIKNKTKLLDELYAKDNIMTANRLFLNIGTDRDTLTVAKIREFDFK